MLTHVVRASALTARLAGAALLAAPAAAQQGQPAQPAGAAQSSVMVTALNPSVLAAGLARVGGKQGEAKSEGGKSFYTLTLPSGVPAVAYFDDCQGGNCKSLVLVVSLAKPANRSLAELDELLRKVNNNVPAAKVFRIDDKVIVQGYIVADYGITSANFETQLRVFSDITASMYQTLNPAPGATPAAKPAG